MDVDETLTQVALLVGFSDKSEQEPWARSVKLPVPPAGLKVAPLEDREYEQGTGSGSGVGPGSGMSP